MIKQKLFPLYGISVFSEATALVFRSPKLLLYTITPVILSIVSLILWLFTAIKTTMPVVDSSCKFFDLVAWELSFYSVVVSATSFLAYIIFTMLFFYLIVDLISIPFMDAMSMKIEHLMTKEKEEAGFWLGVKEGIKSSTVSILRMLIIMIVCLPLLLIPVIGTLIYFLINAWYMGFGFIDFSMGRRGWSWNEKKTFLKGTSQSRLLFGSVCYLLTTIPFINFFAIPLSVAAGTVLFLRIKNSQQNEIKIHSIEEDQSYRIIDVET